ncbi:MAG: PIG-L deacetylase family protein, partial [Nitrospinota bacterium]
MNVLAIGAHPDDIEFGCGGTLLKFAQEGHSVHLLVLTRGEQGGNGDVRVQEQKKSAEILRVQELVIGTYPDTRLPLDKEVISYIEDVMRRVEPDFILTHHPEDSHQDHRTLSQITLSAARYVRNLLFYEVPTTDNFRPTVFTDIGSTFEKKLEALEAHASQKHKTNIEGLSVTDMAR